MYDDLIMDHIRNARNFRVPDDWNRMATGSNPLCGDELTVYLRVEQDRVEDISFQCASCGIAMAASSIMTELIRGAATVDAKLVARSFIAALYGRDASSLDWDGSGQRAILATARQFPARIRCAVLPWATLEGALDGREETVFVR